MWRLSPQRKGCIMAELEKDNPTTPQPQPAPAQVNDAVPPVPPPAEAKPDSATVPPEPSLAEIQPDSASEGTGGTHHHHRLGFWGRLKDIGVRFYALCLVAAVLWPGYKATMYLVRTVFIPTPVPQRFLDWQGHIDAAALRSKDVPGLTGPAARAPLGHYHRVDRWFVPDAVNGCTASGCHEPLPHTTKMKVPAFANFHTTFLTCQMCHESTAGSAGAKLVWVGTESGKAQDTPALLRLMKYLEAQQEQIQKTPQVAQKVFVAALTDALKAAPTDSSIRDLLLQFQTSEPGSPVWRRAVARLIEDMPNHMRGEYGAKLAREQRDGEYLARAKEMAAMASGLRERERELHRTLKTPVSCVGCHDGKSAVDFEAAGYSPTRAQTLQQLEVAKAMQSIREGGTFHIPTILRKPDAR